jgi:hypothetical protein
MTLVPDAIDALIAMARTALPAVEVMDGPEAEWPENEYVAIGLLPNALEIPATHNTAGLDSYRESAEVIGMVRAWSGDVDMRPIRVRAYEIFTALRVALQGDTRLGGAVDRCELVGHVYAPGASERGRWVDLLITWQVVKL